MTEKLLPGQHETERQGLIRELLQLRRDGVNVDRQDVIERSLRKNWVLGWPERQAVIVEVKA